MSSTAYDTMPNMEDVRSPAEAALLARLHRYFQGAIRALPKKDQAKVLSAPNDFWSLMEMLALAPIKESPELRVRLRGAIARRELLENDGGVLSPSSVAELVGISRQSVGQRRTAGKLLAVEGTRGYVYPAWQFDGAETVEGFEEILNLLADEDPWTQFIFFVSEDDAAGGHRPIDLLRKGDVEPVRRAARMHGSTSPDVSCWKMMAASCPHRASQSSLASADNP